MGIAACHDWSFVVALCCNSVPNSVDGHAWAVTTAPADGVFGVLTLSRRALAGGACGPALLSTSLACKNERVFIADKPSRMQCCTTAAAPYAQKKMLEAALSGGTGVSLLEAFPLQQVGAVQAPAERCLLGNSFRGVAAGSEQLVVSQTGTLANSPPSLAATNHNSTQRPPRQRHYVYLHYLYCTGRGAGPAQSQSSMARNSTFDI